MTGESITQHTDADGTVTVAVAGEIDMATSPLLAAALREAISAEETKQLAVDLSQVTFLDSSGIRELVLAYGLAGEQGVACYVIRPHQNARRVLELTGLLDLLTEQAPPDTGITA